jgi:hypothetical protein
MLKKSRVLVENGRLNPSEPGWIRRRNGEKPTGLQLRADEEYGQANRASSAGSPLPRRPS